MQIQFIIVHYIELSPIHDLKEITKSLDANLHIDNLIISDFLV